MKIITISGLDGSGKSTQIEMLETYLVNHGKKVFYFHAVQFSIANISLCHSERVSQQTGESKNLSPRSLDHARDDKNTKSVTHANWLQIMLRRVALLIDLIRFNLLRSKLRSQGFDYLVSDRYFYDSIINIRYLAKSEKSLPCEKFIIKPDLSIYLNAQPQAIMQRSRKPDQGLAYLERKKQLYDNAAPVWNLQIIDGNQSKEKIFSTIKKALPVE